MIDSRNNYAKYIPAIPYPVRADKKPTLGNYDTSNPEQVRKYIEDETCQNCVMSDETAKLFNAAVVAHNQDADEIYHNALIKYKQAQSDCKISFKEDLTFEDIKAGIPQQVIDKVFNIAWDYSHAAGFGEVENTYSELIEIAKIYREIC